MNRYLCIHGHFYQPPRENPWLEVVERQDSAHPYHDWNERITAECYGPNAVSRILNGGGKIAKIVNNYSWISFNIGPTLLHWLEQHRPDVYEAILEADRVSLARFDGHGSAIAQVYNHIIMPLANRRDKITQVRWGLRDFAHRFGRMPEGMWLAETAVDTETLEVLAEFGIRYTILAPHQAQFIRPLQGGAWRPVAAHELDITRPYRVQLASGKIIDLFFYHGPTSRAVAFEKLLSRGERLAERMIEIYDKNALSPQLAHIATDGETYGHHHAHGDMALAYALDYIQSRRLATITNYGAFLEQCPPTWEVKINENSSWSCAHGIGRWSDDCGCNSGGHPGWHQRWRKPLRASLDWLRDKACALFEQKAGALLKDPWEARNDYISVILNRSEANVDAYLHRHASKSLSEEERVQVLQLLEMQRHTQLMYTSCAWFFDEISGIETVQVIQYAARALQLAETRSEHSWEEDFLQLLELAPSNLPEHKNGRQIYEKWVRPGRVNLRKAVKHFAVISLFAEEKQPTTNHHLPIYNYETLHKEQWQVGSDRLLVAEVRIRSSITHTSQDFRVAVLHFGKYNVVGAVGKPLPPEQSTKMFADLKEAFLRADITGVYRLFDRYFDSPTFDLPSLFRDQQREVLTRILDTTMDEVEDLAQHLYQRNASLIRYLMGLELDLPMSLQRTITWVIQAQIQNTLDEARFDRQKLQMLLQEAQLLHVSLDQAHIALGLQERILELAEQWTAKPLDTTLLQTFTDTAQWVRNLPFEVDLYRVQNLFSRLRTELLPTYHQRKTSTDPDEKAWSKTFAQLNDAMQFQAID